MWLIQQLKINEVPLQLHSRKKIQERKLNFLEKYLKLSFSDTCTVKYKFNE